MTFSQPCGRDHFINRLGRWDDPVAVAKAQALSPKSGVITNQDHSTDP
jgi:hypothetical protein